ncbi:hypothetical protein [Streptacidiphilus jiangxiensis]|uniref:Uncharacterized protein n=1 Tax=Streptacidiphilus jiangxiensis TaxID=235985 RepID=A0A1H7MVV7_STRJI|nr:hypothetical protein [Streptacidiphilus jiangxiensis]SEL15432.1 hypothetical protein SAMN05414137_10696 [Streptacidiphilus jiangxiensis]
MDGSVAAVIGAAVGAAGGLGGGWLSVFSQSRRQRDQQRVERDRWRDDIRRDAYAAFLTATRELTAAWWKMADQLSDHEDTTTAEWRTAFAETHDAYARFSAASSGVAIAGPGRTAEAAAALHIAMREWAGVGTEWARAAIGDGTTHRSRYLPRFAESSDAKREPLAAFQRAAREALETEQ